MALLGLLITAGEPLLGRLGARGVALGLLGLDLGLSLTLGPRSLAVAAANDLVLVLAVVGAANVWAQSGMRARHGAVLAGALTVYDLVATSLLPLMTDLIGRVAALPFHPLLVWPLGDGRWLGLGLGDLLLAAVFPLLLRKAYGRAAGLAGVGLSVGAVGLLLGLLGLGLGHGTLPAMATLGPAMLGQYAYWRRARGVERTTWQYLLAEPREPRRPHVLECDAATAALA